MRRKQICTDIAKPEVRVGEAEKGTEKGSRNGLHAEEANLSGKATASGQYVGGMWAACTAYAPLLLAADWVGERLLVSL